MSFRKQTLSVLACLLFAATASAHKERQIPSPPRPGALPDINRRSANTLVVCKPSSKPTKAAHRDIHYRLRTTSGAALAQARAEESAWHTNNRLFRRCQFEHIQEAVNAAGDDTAIKVLPGVYREEPSRAAPTTASGDNMDGSYSYAYQVANPNDQNLVGIMGKKNITLEGTGATREDVLVDGGFVKDVGIRCDRCEGFIVRNLTLQDVNEHGIYVVESDGYIFKNVVGRYAKEYELFSFASDHGLYEDCEAIGGGDSGVYVGGAPNTPGRINTIVRTTKMHHNALGFSGTQGNYVRLEQNDVYDNAIGISFDAEQDHPNFPLNHCEIVDNDIHDNNFDIYAPTSDVPARGPAYDFIHYPIGTGAWIIGGNDCLVRGNRFTNNHCFATLIAQNPLEVDLMGNGIPNRNTHTINVLVNNANMCGTTGKDFWWDETGDDNCWENNGTVTSDPASLPDCSAPNDGLDFPPAPKLALIAKCTITDPNTGATLGPCPFGTSNQAPYQNGNEQQCGDGDIDPGEDCDTYNSSYIPAETCESLGLGAGTLACVNPPAACTWDTSGCTATGCSEYGKSTLRLRSTGAPAGDESLDLTAIDFPSTGRSFNPLTEETSFTLRDDGGAVYGGTIPAGSPNWSTGPEQLLYSDPSGSVADIVRIDLRGTPSLSSSFRATVQLRNANLVGAADALTATVVLRIGDDCWSDTTPCSARGSNVTCRGRAQP